MSERVELAASVALGQDEGIEYETVLMMITKSVFFDT